MTLEQVIGILNSTNCGRIRFRFNSVSGTPVFVAPESFRRVAAAMQSPISSPNHIAFTDAEFSNRPNTTAEYRPDINVFQAPASLQHQSQAIAEASVVHEAVHASFDLTRSIIAVVDNELAAYIAHSIFIFNANYPFSVLQHRSYQHFALYVPSVAASGFLDNRSANHLRRLIETRGGYCKDIWESKMRYRMSANDG